MKLPFWLFTLTPGYLHGSLHPTGCLHSQCLNWTPSTVRISWTALVNVVMNSSETIDSTVPWVYCEYGHGFSKHPIALISIQQAYMLALGWNLQPNVPSAWQQVLDVFSKWVVKQKHCSKKVRFGSTGADLTIAKAETLKGFCGLGLGLASGVQPSGWA